MTIMFNMVIFDLFNFCINILYNIYPIKYPRVLPIRSFEENPPIKVNS